MATETYARGGPRPPPGTIVKLFLYAVARRRPAAMQVRDRRDISTHTHDRIEEWVRRTAFGLAALGVRRGTASPSYRRTGRMGDHDYACLTLAPRTFDLPTAPGADRVYPERQRRGRGARLYG